MPRHPSRRSALTLLLIVAGLVAGPFQPASTRADASSVGSDPLLTSAQAAALGWHAEARLLEAHRDVRDGARATGHAMSVLTPMTDVRDAARAWSSTMATDGTLAHNPSTGTWLCCYREARESVGQARGVLDRWLVDEAVDTLMASFLASDSHRDNLLAPTADDVGVGVTVDRYGNLWASIYVRERQDGEQPPGEAYTPTSLYEAAADALSRDPIPAPAPTGRSYAVACAGMVHDVFADVAATVHAPAIDCVHHLGLMQGTGSDAFAPGLALTRGQAATLTARLLAAAGIHLADTTDHFDDDNGSVHEGALDVVAALGMLDDDEARASEPATRADLARMVAGALSLAGIGGDAAVLPDYFSDDADSPAQDALNLLAHTGVLVGDGDRSADPTGTISRAQAATVLARAADAMGLQPR